MNPKETMSYQMDTLPQAKHFMAALRYHNYSYFMTPVSAITDRWHTENGYYRVTVVNPDCDFVDQLAIRVYERGSEP